MTRADTSEQFQALLNYLKTSRGFDFSAYKPASLSRRILKRMEVVGVDGFHNYVDHLEVHPEEFSQLFNTILINVTSFFRDPDAWDYVASEILPRITAEKPQDGNIRVWSTGCASGEEAYTLAMLLAESLGVEEFCRRVKIYATDVDGDALNYARQATYTQRDIQEVPSSLLYKYFEQQSDRYTFHKEMRRSVIFGRNDLIQDAPISRIDLLVSRNTLMYFNAEAQGSILTRFHFALNDTGVLFLGKAEMLLTHNQLFTPVDLKQRIFKKLVEVPRRDRIPNPPVIALEEPDNSTLNHARMRDAAFEIAHVAQIVVDSSRLLVLANERARALLGLNPKDIRSSWQELEVINRLPELRACIEQTQMERRPISLKSIRLKVDSGEAVYLDLQATPVLENGGAWLGVCINLNDTTRYHRLQSRQELETASEELQSTNEEPPTKSFSPLTKNWRRPTRNCSPPTKSWRQ